MSNRTVYRVQATVDTAWVTQYEPTAAAARETRNTLAELYREVRIDKVEVGTDREGICAALNHADANFTVWPGERIR